MAPSLSFRLLLNAAHTMDHLVLLVFASAVSSIAVDLGMARWEDLMPYTAGAFFMFGLGSIPAGRLGDLWSRRKAMLTFFFGTGASCLIVAACQTPWQLALALTLLGSFASIYHPVGIPMLLRDAPRPGLAIGWNNLAGNLGIALAALVTGLIVQWAGWRAAFVLPGLLTIGLGLLFARVAPEEPHSAARRADKHAQGIPSISGPVKRALIVMTIAASVGSILFNFTTNGNTELFRERMSLSLPDPVAIGAALAALYTVAAFSQVIVGRLTERFALRPLFMSIVAFQSFFLLLAAQSEGWWFYLAALGFMASIFGAIPFTDTIVVRYVEDALRSRVTGMRIGIAFVVSSTAVGLLGPVVKSAGFSNSLMLLAGLSVLTLVAIWSLPTQLDQPQLSPKP
ncbi:MAG: hypothetical protein RLY30_1635 [Pseudomonadota bacterium]|jgi:MFS family permease